FQATLKSYAAESGWKLDSTSDLARVLRIPGTFNRKLDPAVPVKVQEQNRQHRYSPEEFEPFLVLETQMEAKPGRRSADVKDKKNLTPAQIERILAGWGWLQECRDDAAVLGEPEWYAMVSIVGRCENGEQIVHEFSQPHLAYTLEETRVKLQHALRDAGPRTC